MAPDAGPAADAAALPPILDGARMLARLDELGDLGARPGGGANRPAYSELDVAGRDLVARWMNEAGLVTSVDAAGNLIGRSPGPTGPDVPPPLVLGSHFDIVIDAGRLDGCLGVVTGITGRQPVDVVIEGQTNHAGTTPMDLRRDALVAAAHVTLAVENLALEGHLRVATVGTIDVSPNARNIVPGLVTLGLDLRDLDDVRLAASVEHLRFTVAIIAEATGCTISFTLAPGQAAAPCDPTVVAAFQAAATAQGLVRRSALEERLPDFLTVLSEPHLG